MEDLKTLNDMIKTNKEWIEFNKKRLKQYEDERKILKQLTKK